MRYLCGAYIHFSVIRFFATNDREHSRFFPMESTLQTFPALASSHNTYLRRLTSRTYSLRYIYIIACRYSYLQGIIASPEIIATIPLCSPCLPSTAADGNTALLPPPRNAAALERRVGEEDQQGQVAAAVAGAAGGCQEQRGGGRELHASTSGVRFVETEERLGGEPPTPIDKNSGGEPPDDGGWRKQEKGGLDAVPEPRTGKSCVGFAEEHDGFCTDASAKTIGEGQGGGERGGAEDHTEDSPVEVYGESNESEEKDPLKRSSTITPTGEHGLGATVSSVIPREVRLPGTFVTSPSPSSPAGRVGAIIAEGSGEPACVEDAIDAEVAPPPATGGLLANVSGAIACPQDDRRPASPADTEPRPNEEPSMSEEARERPPRPVNHTIKGPGEQHGTDPDDATTSADFLATERHHGVDSRACRDEPGGKLEGRIAPRGHLASDIGRRASGIMKPGSTGPSSSGHKALGKKEGGSASEDERRCREQDSGKMGDDEDSLSFVRDDDGSGSEDDFGRAVADHLCNRQRKRRSQEQGGGRADEGSCALSSESSGKSIANFCGAFAFDFCISQVIFAYDGLAIRNWLPVEASAGVYFEVIVSLMLRLHARMGCT